MNDTSISSSQISKVDVSATGPLLSPKMTGSGDACCDVNHAEHDLFAEKTERWDKIGLFLSSLCALHCLATPLLVLALPVLGDVFHEEWVHILMALFVVPVGLYAFWSGYKHHHQVQVFGLGIAGLVLVSGASLLPHQVHEVVEFYGHDILTIVGSVFLIVAHILNRRACLCHKH